MAGLSFVIGAQTFSVLAPSAGKYAKSFDIDSPEQDDIPSHVKGVAGSYLVQGNLKQQRIACQFIIIDTLANIYAALEGFQQTWASGVFNITSPSTYVYERCKLAGRCTLDNIHPLTTSLAAGHFSANFISYGGKQ